MSAVPVLYLDLDGTVRHGYDELGRFVNGPEDVKVFKEVPSLLARYHFAGWRIVSISNQGGVALGHMSFETCKRAMEETYDQVGGFFDKMMWCIHHPDAESPEMARCWCRKPRAGMVVEAAVQMGHEHADEMYPPHLALFVGDRQEDQECAAAANIEFLRADRWRAGRNAP